jgi:hypothetical protein
MFDGTPYAYLHICGTPGTGNEYEPSQIPIWTMRYGRPLESTPDCSCGHASCDCPQGCSCGCKRLPARFLARRAAINQTNWPRASAAIDRPRRGPARATRRDAPELSLVQKPPK